MYQSDNLAAVKQTIYEPNKRQESDQYIVMINVKVKRNACA